MITDTQARVAKAVVNIFETSSVQGDYSRVTLIPGDTGQLTYGRSQTTLTSGGLFELIDRYCGQSGARFADLFRPFLGPLRDQDPELNGHTHFHNLLRAGADDIVMRDTQDAFFDETYWASAVRIAQRDGISTPLGVAVVYDSRVHGSWARIRRRVIDKDGSVETFGEKPWIESYVKERRRWLAGHSRSDLRRTVYRMNTFIGLIAADQWSLDIPLVIRGAEINLQTLNAVPSGVFDGPAPRSRRIALQSPLARGLDVRLLQLGLSGTGYSLVADGIFGRGTKGVLERFQQDAGLSISGVADSAEFDALQIA